MMSLCLQPRTLAHRPSFNARPQCTASPSCGCATRTPTAPTAQTRPTAVSPSTSSCITSRSSSPSINILVKIQCENFLQVKTPKTFHLLSFCTDCLPRGLTQMNKDSFHNRVLGVLTLILRFCG